MQKKILIASDHAGFELKTCLQKLMPDVAWLDLGPPSADRVDYPDFAEKLCREIQAGRADQGLLICGSGIGMSMAANKFDGIRAALVENPVAAKLSREHNNANVLCLGARFLAPEYAADIVKPWLATPFPGEPRHLERVRKITAIESKRRS